MKEQTFLMITSALPLTQAAPALADLQFFPFSCLDHEVAEAIVTVQRHHNVKALGVVSKDMVSEMLKLMDAFERS